MRLPSARRLLLFLMVAAILAAPLLARDSRDGAGDAGPENSGGPKRHELTKKEREERLRNFKREVGKSYRKWLDEDVAYIITPEERTTFKLLGTNEERDAFIQQFWRRRDPTPDTVENEFRDEYYRRIQYANEHFSAGVPGWRTDRGHMYIVWGPPDEIESHPTGGAYRRPMSEGGGATSTYPFERWRYRHLEGIGDNIIIEFVDSCQCGDYRIATNPNEKDALLNTPGGGPTMLEQMGVSNRVNRITGIPNLSDPSSAMGGTDQFNRLELYNKLNAPPPLKFPELAEIVDSHIRYNVLPFEMRTDFVRVTDETVLVPITIQLRNGDMTFVAKEGIERAAVNIFGRISTLSGRVAATFEDTVGVDEPTELLAKEQDVKQMYWKAVPLQPGLYKIELALKDVNGDRVGTLARSLRVPAYDEEKLSSSSLILADLMERVPVSRVGSGSFVLGDTKVRPRPDASNGSPAAFQRDQTLNIWMQIYNLKPDPQSHQARATIAYDIVNLQTGKSVLHSEETSADYRSHGGQITIEKSMPLVALDPGTYSLKIAVNDEVSQQAIAPSARFRVK
jgi:GWxTD domain-containing protein